MELLQNNLEFLYYHPIMLKYSSELQVVMRSIQSRDNGAVAALIREVMPQFGACGPGFAIMDPEVDDMYGAYPGGRAQYFVMEVLDSPESLKRPETIWGCGGFAPLVGGNETVCELRKMYFFRELRGLGWGSRLMTELLKRAKAEGFKTCYLETLKNMTEAQALYRRFGFEVLTKPLGRTGHGGCDVWMEKQL